MQCLLVRERLATTIPLALGLNLAFAATAEAHVKWFCAFDVAGNPRSLQNVLCQDFEFLFGLTVLSLMAGCLVEGTQIGAAMLRSMDRATAFLQENTELLFRAGCGFFFVAIWAVGGILLTPELKTTSPVVGMIQLGVAAGMLSRRTMPLSAIGIALLFLIGVWQYGAFHLADYPVFLGVAAYLALTGLQRDFLGARPIDVVRWTASVTLMWASVEKWAYPEWSFPLFIEHPTLSMGLDPEFFMRAAGAVEFALAFALIWTPLVRRIAAVILTAMFTSAVFEFGKIDMIGHTLIVVVLVAIIADQCKESAWNSYRWLVPVTYTAALVAFLGVYYAAHSLFYGSPII
jgi:hypothetical protein